MFQKLMESSQDPTKVSMLVKSTLLLLVPIMVGLAKYYGFDQITDEALKNFIDLIAQLVQALFGLIALGGMVWGMVRKFVEKPK